MNVLCSILHFVKCWDLHLKYIKTWNVSIIYIWLNSNTRGHIVYGIRMSMASGNPTLNQMDHLSTQGEVPRAHQDDVQSIADVTSTSSQELQSVTRHTLAVVGLAAADNASDQLLSESQCRTPSAESSNRSCVVDMGPSKTVLSIFDSWTHMANNFHYRAINFFMALLSCYEFQILRKLFKSTECFIHLTDHSSFKSMYIYRRKYLKCKTNYFLFACKQDCHGMQHGLPERTAKGTMVLTPLPQTIPQALPSVGIETAATSAGTAMAKSSHRVYEPPSSTANSVSRGNVNYRTLLVASTLIFFLNQFRLRNIWIPQDPWNFGNPVLCCHLLCFASIQIIKRATTWQYNS